MYEYFEILTYIARKKGLFGKLESSTALMAHDLKISQQSVSRKLRDMEAKDLIKRNVTTSGIEIAISEKGRDFLKRNYGNLKNIFSGRNSFTGKVQNGIGEGRYYVALAGYQKQFIKKLKFKPYFGTLNLQINKSEVNDFLTNLEKIDISGFRTKSRTFGSLKCYKVKINSIEAAIVIPERARHSEDIIEIIAPVYLRTELNLKDGDKIKISI